MISPDITFVLLIFLAECVRFLTYLGEVTYHLFKIRSRLKKIYGFLRRWFRFKFREACIYTWVNVNLNFAE